MQRISVSVNHGVRDPAAQVPGGGVRGPELQPLVHHGAPPLRRRVRRERGRETLTQGPDVRGNRHQLNCSIFLFKYCIFYNI